MRVESLISYKLGGTNSIGHFGVTRAPWERYGRSSGVPPDYYGRYGCPRAVEARSARSSGRGSSSPSLESAQQQLRIRFPPPLYSCRSLGALRPMAVRQRVNRLQRVSKTHVNTKFLEMISIHAKISILASLSGRVNRIQCGCNPMCGAKDSQ